MAQLKCWNCGASLAELPRPITRHMNCPACFEDLHCCRLCRRYRAGAGPSCDDERADPPIHKEGANFCDYFRPSPDAYRPAAWSRQASARAELDALFQGGADHQAGDAEEPAAPEDDADAARRKLDDLFR